MSKQAMNQLLQSLEKWGYVYRAGAKDGGRAVVVYSTRRGDAVWQKMLEILVEIEDQWRRELGQERFAQLKELLSEVWLSPLVQADLARPAT
jgi:DNA-binding MarR family transcriptional regulator